MEDQANVIAAGSADFWQKPPTWAEPICHPREQDGAEINQQMRFSTTFLRKKTFYWNAADPLLATYKVFL